MYITDLFNSMSIEIKQKEKKDLKIINNTTIDQIRRRKKWIRFSIHTLQQNCMKKENKEIIKKADQ